MLQSPQSLSSKIGRLNDLFVQELIKFYKDATDKPNYLGSNKWIYSSTVNLYVKSTFRHIQGEYVRTLEVSNVRVHKTRDGLYDALLSVMYSLLQPGEALFIENVLDPSHIPIYTRRGFQQYNIGQEGSPSFFVLKV